MSRASGLESPLPGHRTVQLHDKDVSGACMGIAMQLSISVTCHYQVAWSIQVKAMYHFISGSSGLRCPISRATTVQLNDEHIIATITGKAVQPLLSITSKIDASSRVKLKPSYFIVTAGSGLVCPLNNLWAVQLDAKDIPAGTSIGVATQTSHGFPCQDDVSRAINLHCTWHIIAGASSLKGPLPCKVRGVNFHGINVCTAAIGESIQATICVTCQDDAWNIHITGSHKLRSRTSFHEAPLIRTRRIQLHDEDVVLACIGVSMQSSKTFPNDINLASRIGPNTRCLIIASAIFMGFSTKIYRPKRRKVLKHTKTFDTSCHWSQSEISNSNPVQTPIIGWLPRTEHAWQNSWENQVIVLVGGFKAFAQNLFP